MTAPLKDDVRVGSTTNGLQAISVAERSLAAGAWQWAGLAAVAIAAIVADQVTKYLVTSRLSLDQSVKVVGPLSIHHVQNSGIAFGLFPDSTAAVVAVTSAAVVWMVVFFARSGSRHPGLSGRARAAARRQRLEPRRPRSASAT